MPLQATYRGELTIVEPVTVTGLPAASGGATIDVTHNGFNTNVAFTTATAPDIELVAVYEKALAAGTGSIDLVTHTGSNGAVKDFTGKSVRAFKFKAKDTNAGPITLTEGAANGYELLGNAWKVELKPGAEVMGVFPLVAQQAPVVGAAAKVIDLTGTGTDVVQVELIAG